MSSPYDPQLPDGVGLPLTVLIHVPFLNPGGERLGRLEDVLVRLADRSGYPLVIGLKVRIGGRDLFVSIERVGSLESGRVQLQDQTLNLGRFERRPGEVLLREDVLDRRLINVATARLVHANDLVLAQFENGWHLVGVDPSPRRAVQRLLPRSLRRPEVHQLAQLDWKDIQPFVGHVPLANPLLPTNRLKRLHPAQIADLVEASSHDEGAEIIGAVMSDPELSADLFEELDTEHQREFLKSLKDEEAAALLANMATDDAADLLHDLDQDRRLPVLSAMPAPLQQKIRKLLQYNPATAGGLMSPDFVAVPRGSTLAEALAHVRADEKTPAQLLGTVFVTEADGSLIGGINTVDLVRGDTDARIEDQESLVGASMRVEDDLESVALQMSDFNLTAIPVVEASGQLIGAISVDDVLEAVIPDDWRRRAEASRGD